MQQGNRRPRCDLVSPNSGKATSVPFGVPRLSTDLFAKLKDAKRAQCQRHKCTQNHRAQECHREGERARKCEKAHLHILRILKHKNDDDDQDDQQRKQPYPRPRRSRRADNVRSVTSRNSSLDWSISWRRICYRCLIVIVRLIAHQTPLTAPQAKRNTPHGSWPTLQDGQFVLLLIMSCCF